MDHAGSAGAFQQGVLDLVGVNHGDPQTGGAAVHVREVRLAAQALEDQGRGGVGVTARRGSGAVGAHAGLGLEVGAGEELGLLVVVLTAGGLEVHLGNHEVEGEVVQEEVDHAHDHHPDPVGLGVALEDAEEGQVDEAAGEGHAHAHVKDVHQHVGQAGVDAVDRVHGGGHKEEGEFQRLGDAGEHGGQGGGDQKAAGDLPLFGLGGPVHSQGGAGQAEDHEGELARHKAGGRDGEDLGGLGSQLGEEDVLGALDGDPVDDGGAAHGGLPEGHIEHMVQAEGDQGPLDQAVDPGARVAGADDQVAQGGDAVLDHRPDKEQADAHDQKDDAGDDGHKPGAAEEGEHLGQLDLIELVVEGGHPQAHDDAAKDAHLKGGDAQHGGGGVGRHGLHAAVGVDQGRDGGVHNQVGDGAGEGGHLFFLLGHADGHAHGKQQGQVVEDGAAALVHDVQHGIDDAALIDDAGQAVGLQHGGVGEGAANAQQKAGHRQQGDGEHKGAAHTLQNAEDLVFHNDSSFWM